MPKYIIEREIPGASALTPADLQRISRNSNAVLLTMGGDVQWVQSYVNGDRITCIYIAPNEERVREHADRVRRVERAALQALAQVSTLDVAHGDEEEVLGRPRLVDRDDVRMVDGRGQLRLAQEAVTERFVPGEAGSKQLQRHPPLQPQILGQVDDAHPAEAQQRLDPVAGDLAADQQVIAHFHVCILAFGRPARTIGGVGRICAGRGYSTVSGT